MNEEPKKKAADKTSTNKKKKDEGPFEIKRDWAKKAESDDDAVYEGIRRTKGFETIKDLEKCKKRSHLNIY